MRNVLFIAYLYPPLNCGVCRQSKIAKYLPLYGWNPVVLTVKKSRIRPQYDESLMKDVPPHLSIYRTRSLESKLIQYIPSLLHINHKYCTIPDPFIGWLPCAIMKGLDIIKKEKVDALFSTSMPHTSHLIALILKKMTKLPWVADFRESWTGNPFVVYPEIVLKMEKKMEAAVIKNADALTAINDPIRNDFAAKYPEQSHKCMTISHGFDPEDFQGIQLRPSKKFTILYAGSLYGRRTPGPFFNAVKQIIEEDPSMKNAMRIHFVGHVDVAEKMVDQLGIGDVVDISGFIPHEKVRSHMVNADILLLIIGSGKDDSKISTGKLFDYLGSGTSILALVPPGTAADVIQATQAGVVVHPDDIAGIKQAIYRFYQKYQKGEPIVTPQKETINQYNVRILTKRVSEILDSVTQKKK